MRVLRSSEGSVGGKSEVEHGAEIPCKILNQINNVQDLIRRLTNLELGSRESIGSLNILLEKHL